MYNSNIYKNFTKRQKERDVFCEYYKDFLSKTKTERLAIIEIEKLAIEKGFKKINDFSVLKPGDRVYFKNKDKNIILYKIGKKPIVEGIKILAAHIDSPRMDVKANPLYEKNGFVLFDTHYYGAIKTYQYVTTPLSMVGVVYKKDGSVVEVNIGEDCNDPVFGVPDLLIHLSAEQMQKKLEKAIEGENLDVIIGTIPINNNDNLSIKTNILKILKEKYNIDNEDFISSEIEIVPSGKARDVGLDRSMIAAYGQDDRVCTYTALRALLDSQNNEYTQSCVFVDKEEVGNVGATGSNSLFFENSLLELLHKLNIDTIYNIRKSLENSFLLSCDVGAALDPIYCHVSDENNSAKFNYGVLIQKYMGSGGKFYSNDANPKDIAKLRSIFDKNNIHYQTGELGCVDMGSGSTIAYKFAEYNMDVVDVGVPILNMHSPMEIVAKADVYEAYLAYKVFLENNDF